MSDLTYDPSSQKCSATSAYGTSRNHLSVHCADASSLSGLFLENSWTHWGHLVSCVTKTEHVCRVAAEILWWVWNGSLKVGVYQWRLGLIKKFASWEMHKLFHLKLKDFFRPHTQTQGKMTEELKKICFNLINPILQPS